MTQLTHSRKKRVYHVDLTLALCKFFCLKKSFLKVSVLHKIIAKLRELFFVRVQCTMGV